MNEPRQRLVDRGAASEVKQGRRADRSGLGKPESATPLIRAEAAKLVYRVLAR